MTTVNYRQSEGVRGDSMRPGSMQASPIYNRRHEEGPVARSIERHTAAIPSDMYLWAAGLSIGGSLALRMAGRRHDALFVGQWAPTFLILGLYNKMVKQQGSDWRHQH